MDMFIEIKFPVNTHTQNIYFLYKRNVYTPNETWTFALLRLPGNTIPWNLSAYQFVVDLFDQITHIPQGCFNGNTVAPIPVE